MKKQTIDILKNFAGINTGILIKKGNRLETVSGEKNVLASVSVEDTFPVEHAIYNLNEFLSVISLLNVPSLDYGKDSVVLSSGGTKVRYVYSSPTTVVSPPDIDLSVKSPILSFDLTDAQLAQILKASSVMQLPDLLLTDTGLQVYNKKNKSGSNYSLVPENLVGKAGTVLNLSVALLKLLPGNYSVKTSDAVVEFRSKDIPSLVYFVAVEVNE